MGLGALGAGLGSLGAGLGGLGAVGGFGCEIMRLMGGIRGVKGGIGG